MPAFHFFLVAFSGNLFAQREITGKISDALSADPLTGAAVKIKGTTKGTIADFNGNFKLMVSEADILIISFVGYQTVEMPVKGQNNLDIKMQANLALPEVLLVGTRKSGRTLTETPVAIDVIPIEEIAQSSGQVDLQQILQFAAPAFNSNRQAGSDGSDHIDAATLRGLGPDQVLVLVNGKRYHPSSLVNVFGSRARGNVGVDLNTIPTAAIERVEILRDGAAAQYGSDAIAGVINIVLKNTTDVLSANLSTGAFSKELSNHLKGETPEKLSKYLHTDELYRGAGVSTLANVNYGTKLGEKGFVSFTGEVVSRGATDRANEDNARIIGDSKTHNANTFVNALVPLANESNFYAYGGLNFRNGLAGAWYRSPDDDRNIPSIYPDGFVPNIRTNLFDQSLTAGIDSKVQGWDMDFSFTTGKNRMQYYVENSLNTSMGDLTPKNFEAGGFTHSQNTANLGFTRNYESILAGFNIAWGLEHRLDRYTIFAGEDASWQNYGPVAELDSAGNTIMVDKAGGAQGFPGFRPVNALDKSRTNIGAYIDAELDINEKFMVGAALRRENYSDFGSNISWKLASRYEFVPEFALRASASTGFRAPSLQQRYFNSTYTDFVSGVATDVVISRNDSKIVQELGIPSLTEETSFNYSLGIVSNVNNFSLTVDYYSIAIDDRIVLTGYFYADDADIAQEARDIIARAGASAASFFANAINTKTTGVDAVASYRNRLGTGIFNAALAVNWNTTKQDGDVKTTPLLANKADVFFGERERLFIEGSAPKIKGNLTLNYDLARFGAMLRLGYFGEVIMGTWSSGGLIQTYPAKTSIDASVNYQFNNRFRLTIGANNLTNAYPAEQNPDETESGGPYESVQMGYGGSYYFARLGFNF
ncbi:MAG: TonB-dependent receptor [Sphingobacteriales bacterium]|nr:TonB-dependent receptor [Sphingobacteriales bacterium]